MNLLANFHFFYAVFSTSCWWSLLAEIVRKLASRVGESSILRNLRVQNAALNRMKNLRSFEDKFTRTNMQTYSILDLFWHPKSIRNRIKTLIENRCIRDAPIKLPKCFQDAPRCSLYAPKMHPTLILAPNTIPKWSQNASRCYQGAPKMLPRRPRCT